MPLCSPFGAELAAPTLVNNVGTGAAYVLMMVLFILAPNGIIREDYKCPVSVFVGACGGHHLAMALCAPPLAQVTVDSAMTLISIITAGYVAYDVGGDLLRRWRGG